MADAGDVDIAAFLADRSPFQELTESEVARIAAHARVVAVAAGEVVAEYGDHAADAMWMVVTGRVDLSAPEGDPVGSFETVGAGDLFGYIPLIIGPGVRFIARAAGPATLIRLPADQVRDIFEKRAGVAFVAESAWQTISGHSVTGRPPRKPVWSAATRVGELVVAPPVVVDADTAVADAVRAMSDAGQSCVLIHMIDGSLGIVTESDVAHRVVGAGLGGDVPVSAVMTVPARAVDADRYALTTWLEMLEAGVRHMPVLSTRGRAIGVLTETDLLVAASRGGSAQRAIAEATDISALRTATAALPRLADELFGSGLDAESTCGVLSLVVDTTARRAVELAAQKVPGAHLTGGDFSWISLGSVARREAMPSSDVDSALSWSVDNDGDADTYRALARDTHAILDACGLPGDSNGALAYTTRFSRSADDWRRAARQWLDTPLDDHGLIMSSLLIDGRVIIGPASLHTAPAVYAAMRAEHPEALRLQLLDALSRRPRIRGLRDILSRRGGTVDLKKHVVTPIVNLARWAGLTAGITCAPTPARLHSAVDVGTLSAADATILHDVFALTQRLRLRHQIEQIRAGHSPTDVIVMSDLSPLDRSMLAEGVREVVGIQRRVRTHESLTNG
ncbi:putative nucleotidyltransferase substrate binding domain-containing protein [Gordonia sp. VNK1]|uniref:putative nucleotidyltransferase substrate binding domain-containing protein n=1 Tax=Gordonia oleivorans TaxID=3156618 RepID=UPI0032B4DB8F